MKTAIQLIIEERQRQIEVEGWSLEHDDHHTDGQLAAAAATYADSANYHGDFPLFDGSGKAKVLISRNYRWPFEEAAFKPCPDNRIRELAKAGALILAEMGRLQRQKLQLTKHLRLISIQENNVQNGELCAVALFFSFAGEEGVAYVSINKIEEDFPSYGMIEIDEGGMMDSFIAQLDDNWDKIVVLIKEYLKEWSEEQENI